MAEEEIIQKFKVVDAGATAALGAIDEKIQDVKSSTTGLDASTRAHGEANKKAGEHVKEHGSHLGHTRHALRLFAEATGASSGELMTMFHSITTLGPALGVALGAFILLKSALESQAEAAEKAKEHYDQLSEAVRKYQEARKEKANVLEYGEQGAAAHKEQLDADAEMKAAQKRLNELNTGRSANYGSKSVGGKSLEFIGMFVEQFKSVFSGETEGEFGERRESEKGDLAGAIGRMGATEKDTQRDKDKYKGWNDTTRETQIEMNKLDIQSTYARGENLEIIEKQVEALHKQVQAHKEIAKHLTEDVAQEEMKKQIQTEEMALAAKYNERDDKFRERAIKSNDALHAPSVFGSAERKATFAEDKRYEAEKFEADKAGINTEAITFRHEQAIKKIKMDAAREITNEQVSIHAQQLRNEGNSFEAEKEMAENHYKEILEKHTGNSKLQKLDLEQYNADVEKLTIAHNNEIAAYTSELTEEAQRIKGDQYGSERTALEEWHRKELEMHKDQAEQINKLYAQKSGDINRREKDERAKTLGGYQVERMAALMGQGVGGVLKMQQEHGEKQAEYARTGHTDYAQAEEAAYEAKIRRMKHESDLELSSKKGVGFMDVSSGWETFAASLGKSPKEQEQLNELKNTNVLLTRIDASLAKGGGELIQ